VTYLDGDWSTPISFQKYTLATPTVSYENNTFSWQKVAYATAYLLSVDGEETTLTQTSYTLAEAGTKSIKVKAINEDKDVFNDSDWSEELTCSWFETCLNAPIIKIENKTLYWDAVDGATAYVININGNNVASSYTDTTYLLSNIFQSVEVKVKAVDGEAEYGDSTWSNVETYTPKKEMLNNCEDTSSVRVQYSISSLDSYRTEGDSSIKVEIVAFNYGEYCVVDLKHDSVGNIISTEELLAFEGLCMDVYNPGDEVVLYFFDWVTPVATLKTGWNQVIIDKTTLETQIMADSSQFVSGEFRFILRTPCTLYFDNVCGIL